MKIKTETVDVVLLTAVLGLLTLGTLMVYSASSVAAQVHFNDSLYFLKRQLTWVLAGLALMFATMRLDYHWWQKSAKPLFIFTLVLLTLVLVPGLGKVVNGARRWLGVGGLYIQPSELAKYTMVLFMAVWLQSHSGVITQVKRGLLPVMLILGIVFALILKEPDLGTGLAIAGTVFIMLFTAGGRLLHLGCMVAAGVGGVIGLILLEPYRMRRLTAFQDPWSDPLNTGYHVIQSLYALGSGGLFGVGFGMSREKFLYLPEPHTDFIFAVLGEETGLAGTLLALGLFCVMAWRGLRTALRAPDMYGTLLAAGITMTIFIQALMNIAVVTASMPVTGIPLPFLSFGGSALVVTLGAVGILLNISGQSK